jgi:peptide-methionine (R)-S-oxide reductase
MRSEGRTKMSDEFEKSDAEWRALLSPEAYRILRQKGTERAFTGEYYATKQAGTYLCAGCGQALFESRAKYDSGSGWPSFYQAIAPDRVATDTDTSHGMVRVEITCSRCGGHLGHVFEDGPRPTGLRFCVNSASLRLKPEDEPSR